ncbi:hypothetical protein OAP25_02175 [Flavobacteriaceae bacterium]|nr:hypothetical protein [Flavobacteriaceae bacterium]
MNRKEIIEGVKRKGSHGLILSPNLKKPDREKLEADKAVFFAGGGEIEQIASVDEFKNTKKASAVYSQN